MATFQNHPNDNYEETIQQSKRQMSQILSNVLTSDVREACPGIALVLLSVDEYIDLMELLNKRLPFKQTPDFKNQPTPVDIRRQVLGTPALCPNLTQVPFNECLTMKQKLHQQIECTNAISERRFGLNLNVISEPKV